MLWCKLGFSTQASQKMDIVIVCYGVSQGLVPGWPKDGYCHCYMLWCKLGFRTQAGQKMDIVSVCYGVSCTQKAGQYSSQAFI
jgi:hypothetical protein